MEGGYINGGIYIGRNIDTLRYMHGGNIYEVERRNIHTKKVVSDSGGEGCSIFYVEPTMKNNKEPSGFLA